MRVPLPIAENLINPLHVPGFIQRVGEPEQITLILQLPCTGTPELIQFMVQFRTGTQHPALPEYPLNIRRNIAVKPVLF